jgi:hypothetical protein
MLADTTISHQQGDLVRNCKGAWYVQRRSDRRNIPDCTVDCSVGELNGPVPDDVVSLRRSALYHRSSVRRTPQDWLNRFVTVFMA